MLNENHWKDENYTQRVNKKQAQHILLNHEKIIFQGYLRDIKVKHVGAGIYEVRKAPKRT